MKIADLVRFVRAVRRIRQVASIFAKHGFYQIITNIGLSKFFVFKKYLQAAYPESDYINVPPEIRLRYALEELGPTFIKLGQVFSQEIRTLPAKYIAELRKLQDSVRADYNEKDEIGRLFKAETGQDIGEVFSEFEEKPVASASIAQVHRAVLKDGRVVAVKLKKRNVDKIIKNDIDVLYFIVKAVKDAVKELIYIENAEDVFREFSKNILSELDFMAEAGYTEKIRKSNMDGESVVIPQIYWDYSTKNILVEDFIDGVKLSDIDGLAERNIDKEAVLKIFLNHFFKQIFIIGYFNADPHPGNVFAISSEKVGIIDFGSIGILTKDIRKKILKYFIDFFNGDYESAAETFIDICLGDLTEKEEQFFKFELMEFIDSFYNKPFKDMYSSEILMETLRIGQKNKLTIPSELSILFKALLPIESIAKALDPEFSFVDSGKKFFDFEALIDKKEKVKDIKETFVEKIRNYKDFFSGFPKRAEKILKKMSEDSFSIDFIHKGLDGLILEMEKSSKRLTSGVLVASLIISSGALIFIGSEFKHVFILWMGVSGWVLGLVYILVLFLK